IAQQFKSRANIPNCLGAVDGKHILCDSNYLLTYVDIGAYDLPGPEIISMDGNRLSYVFIGDEAFGLNEHMLRPYRGR
ncbi:protein ALP1-like, partial [Aphis craccivora]